MAVSHTVNLPNAITLGRIFLVPLLVVVLLTEFEGRRVLGVPKDVVGAGIFALASLTDWLDGYLARRRKQVTGLGQWMDPLADKLLVTAAFVSLLYLELAPAWMVTVIIGREFFVTVLRSIAHARGQVMPASPLGKVKMVAQVAAILILILNQGHLLVFYYMGQAALWIATLSALVSAVDYSRRINVIMTPRPAPEPVAAPDAPAAATPKEARKRISA